MSKKKSESMEDQLREAIRVSGMPQNRICRAAQMDEGTLSCFMLGKQESMRLKTAQRLARVLGFELVLHASASHPPREMAAPKARKKAVGKAKKSKSRPASAKKRRR